VFLLTARDFVRNSVSLKIKLLGFSWKHEFKVLNGGPFPVILGLDFMERTSIMVDVVAKTYRFGFALERVGVFVGPCSPVHGGSFFSQLIAQIGDGTEDCGGKPGSLDVKTFTLGFPALFSPTLGSAKCEPYEIELSDAGPVRSAPYRCAPPKAAVLKAIVDDLLDQGVVRPSKSPYASPAFLVAKPDGGSRLVVDYRKVNARVLFDSYPMPTIEQALDQFAGASVFSVLDLNSAYYQIPLSERSRRITAFCTPFGLFEFNKLPMGISVGSQGLSRVIDDLFADLKGEYLFNFVDDLVVYSPSAEIHVQQLREVLRRLQYAGFTLNPGKVVLGVSEIKYLGHLKTSFQRNQNVRTI
jgi:hypothetical protein